MERGREEGRREGGEEQTSFDKSERDTADKRGEALSRTVLCD